jgi:hypothetical protein
VLAAAEIARHQRPAGDADAHLEPAYPKCAALSARDLLLDGDVRTRARVIGLVDCR